MAYATSTERDTYGIRSAAFGTVTSTVINGALDTASALMDSYFAPVLVLPLTAWDAQVKRCCCHIADWDLLAIRGFNPDQPVDAVVRQRYDDAIAWLEKIAAKKILPTVTDSSTNPVSGVSAHCPNVGSASSRGWSNRGTTESSSDYEFQHD